MSPSEKPKPGLLNFTKKTCGTNFLASALKPELLYNPFCRTVSRIEYCPDLFQYDLKAEYLPDFFKKKIPSYSWEECCYRRAKELLDLGRSQYYISWSGGIDSTVMIISLLLTWPRDALKKVIIYLSHSSVYENPAVFDLCIAQLPLRSSLVDISSELVGSDALLVTGELGDQMFGSDILGPAAKTYGDQILWKNYKETVPGVIDLWNRKEGTGRAIFEHFHPIVEECPFPIRTTYDFFWWLNFSQKFQHVKYRFVELCSWDLRAKYGKQILHFFDTPYFQRWSLDNHDLKIGKTWESYKLEAKKFIVKFTKNSEDYKQDKIPSLALRNFLVEKRLAVNSAYQAIQTPEELEYYVRKKS